MQSTTVEDPETPIQSVRADCKAFGKDYLNCKQMAKDLFTLNKYFCLTGDSKCPSVPHKRVRSDSLSSWHTSACREAIKNVAQIYEKEGAEKATNSVRPS